MKSLTFRDASGWTRDDISDEELKSLVYNENDSYWAGGSGESVLTFFENGKQKSQMLISALDEFGFMLHHNYFAEERESVLAEGRKTGEIIEITIGGNPMPCFSEYFVSKDIAWEAIDRFLQNGERSDQLKWQHHEMPELAF